jgi:hypothetical protein
MRATLKLDDEIAFALSERAARDRTTFEDVVNAVLRMGLTMTRTQLQPKAYRLEPSSMGGVHPGINLDKALSLADDLEDQATARRLQLSK